MSYKAQGGDSGLCRSEALSSIITGKKAEGMRTHTKDMEDLLMERLENSGCNCSKCLCFVIKYEVRLPAESEKLRGTST